MEDVHIALDVEYKTSFWTIEGLFESLEMFFRRTNAPPLFASFTIDTLAEFINWNITAYLNDILISSDILE